MSKTKNFIVIRIMCFFLIGVVFSSSIFISFSNTLYVHAEESYQPDDADLASAIMDILCAVLGFLFPEASGAIAVGNIISQGGITIADYLTDNGDGTYTIDEELIQAVNEIICNDYVDGQVEQDEDGFYNYGGYRVDFYIKYNGVYVKRYIECTAFQHTIPLVAIVNEEDFMIYGLNASGTVTKKNDYATSFAGNKGSCTWYEKGTYYDEKTATGDALNIYYKLAPYTAEGATEYSLTYSIPFPVFSDVTTATNALTAGDYTDALNYRAKTFETSSRFTGLPYTGGDVVVSAAVLDGISAKVDEINETTMTTDEKVDALYDYVFGDDSVSDGDSGDDTSEDEEEPATIMEWLKKINENLEKILTQVKQIKWLSVADLIDDIIFNLIELKNDFEPLVQTMSEKFPFSLPWDTVLIFSLLADSPETPHYEIPFVIPSAGIDEVLIVDLARFEKLSKISRFLLTLTFLMMLFALTRKIAHWLGNNKS